MKKWLYLVITVLIATGSCKKDSVPAEETPIDSSDVITPFENVPATEDVVMYEIHPWAFSASGDFQGIIDRMDSIKALGINTIWLMPIYAIGIVNSFGSPYCIRDYYAVNSDLGSMDDLKMLVDKAHEKNIAVILDWVANHTSWDNGWIANTSWYTQDGSGNIISPPGTTWNDVADLNYTNSDMRLAMIDAMKFWIETANVDGFRCDAADFVPFDFWEQAIDSLQLLPGRDLILLAEGIRTDHFTAGFQMNYSWDFYGALTDIFTKGYSVTTLYTTNTTEYSLLPAGTRKLRFTTNHDESNKATPVEVFNGMNGALCASVLAIYLQGAPLIYCGQEVGVDNTSTYMGSNYINWNENPEMLSAYKKLLGFYNSSDAARRGTLLTFEDANCAAFEKIFGTEKILVIANTRSISKTFNVPTALQNITWTNEMDGSSITLSATVTLNPYQFLVLGN